MYTRTAVLGLLLVLPALILVSTGLLDLQVELPGTLIHPVLVMGSILVAFAVNAFPLFRVRPGVDGDALVGTMSLRLRGTSLNLAAVGLSTLLLAVIVVYLFVENFQPR